jgi:hypothetical protein
MPADLCDDWRTGWCRHWHRWRDWAREQFCASRRHPYDDYDPGHPCAWYGHLCDGPTEEQRQHQHHDWLTGRQDCAQPWQWLAMVRSTCAVPHG